ncbi:MAG: hypothetical protein Q7R70_05080 [Candidatus Diapherotrites archaeon]|nr:hypothetical protein [Candidatus Diapherotrites archaeon]
MGAEEKMSREAFDRFNNLKMAYGSMIVDFTFNALKIRMPMASDDELVVAVAKRLRKKKNEKLLEKQNSLL